MKMSLARWDSANFSGWELKRWAQNSSLEAARFVFRIGFGVGESFPRNVAHPRAWMATVPEFHSDSSHSWFQFPFVVTRPNQVERA